MKALLLFLTIAFVVSARAQLPATSPTRAGFDPARLEVLHAITKRFVDEKQHAEMLLNGGALDGRRILGRKTVELMTADHMVTLPNDQAATRQKGFGLGVEVTTDPGRLSIPSSIGQFGWYGAATTYCQIDPRERIVAVAFVQHFPFNEHNFFARFATGYYQALK